MADTKKYIDLQGNPLLEGQTNQSTIDKKYIDLQGNPLGIPTGSGGVTPQMSQAVDQTAQQAPGFVGKLATESLPFAGAALTGPGIVPTGLGIAGGTILKNILKSAAPGTLGKSTFSSEDPIGSTLGDIGSEELAQGAVPWGMGKLAEGTVNLLTGNKLSNLISQTSLKNLPGVRDAVQKQITQQIFSQMGQPETQILESGAQSATSRSNILQGQVKRWMNLENARKAAGSTPSGQYFYPGTAQAVQKLEDIFGSNKIGGMLTQLQKDVASGVDVANSSSYKQIAGAVLSDVNNVRNWKVATGSGYQGVENLAINKLLTGGFKETEGTVDAAKILNELGGANKEIYEEAISPQTMSNFKNLINEIHVSQTGHGVADALVKSAKGHLIWSAPAAASLLTGHRELGSLFGGLGVFSGSVTLTNQMLAKAMENPTTAKLVVQAMRTPTSSPQAGLINKILSNTFRAGGAATEANNE